MSLHTQELRVSFVLLTIIIECYEILNSRFALEHRYLLVQAVKNVKKSETILREEDPFSDDNVVGDEAMTRYFVEYEENDIVKNLWYSVKKGEEEEITIMKLLQEMLNRTWCSSVEFE